MHKPLPSQTVHQSYKPTTSSLSPSLPPSELQHQQQPPPPPQRTYYPVAMPMPVSMITGVGGGSAVNELHQPSPSQHQHVQQHHQQHMPYPQPQQPHRGMSSNLPPIQTAFSYSMDGRDMSSSSLSSGYMMNNLAQHRMSGNMSGSM